MRSIHNMDIEKMKKFFFFNEMRKKVAGKQHRGNIRDRNMRRSFFLLFFLQQSHLFIINVIFAVVTFSTLNFTIKI